MDSNKIVWLTDIHLNFLKPATRVQFYGHVAEGNPNKILITGDIAEAKDVSEILDEFSKHVNIPIYFGSVLNVREEIRALCKHNSKLIWLGNQLMH